MDWIEISVTTQSGGADAVSELMMGCGARGTQILDRADIPTSDSGAGFGELYGDDLVDKLPREVTVKAWYASPEEALSARQAVAALREKGLAGMGALDLASSRVQDEDWAENWKQYYKPMRVGRRLVIRPVWEAYQAEADDLVITMDPGMAFGTGTHETTRLCLLMIEQHVSGGRALDIGTGSGILAIALARLGCLEVCAVDIDPVAVKAASENIARNGLTDRITVRQGDLARSEQGQFDFICANILADVIISLAPALPKLMAPHARFLASGIIREREQDVLKACQAAGLHVQDRRAEGEWVALLCSTADA